MFHLSSPLKRMRYQFQHRYFRPLFHPLQNKMINDKKSRQKCISKKRMFLICSLSLLLFLCVYGYYLVMLKHGTFLPPFVHYRTFPFKLHEMPDYSIKHPSSFTNPPFRVVVSLTTMPHHMNNLSETIKSLLQQTLQPQKIYINIPLKSERSGAAYPEIPMYLRELEEQSNSIVHVLRTTTDHGPLTKLLPVLYHELNDSTLIVTVDDDKIYPSDIIQYLAWYSNYYPNIAWGECGWSFLRVFHIEIQVVPIYVPFVYRVQNARQVEVLQAVCGNAYRRKHFSTRFRLGMYADNSDAMLSGLEILASPPMECFTTDDLWISGFLQFYANVSRVLIRERIEPIHTKWKEKNIQSQWDLSTVNSKSSQDIKCIRAIEKRFRQTWLR